MSGRRAAAALAALALALAGLSSPAAAAPPAPAGLEVAGGQDVWRADRDFHLTWTNPPLATPPLAVTHYRLRDPEGAIAEEGALPWTQTGVTVSATPTVPGVYEARVWLEDAGGVSGPPAVAQLRFDDARPAPVEPLPIPEWLGRGAFPLRVGLTHPAGPAPLSGIRGYAASIGPGPSGTPCLAKDRCSEAETTLPGGIDDDVLTIASLPEGVNHLHVVAVSGTGMSSADSGHAALRVDTVDPVVRLSGVPAGWTNRVVRLTATATDTAAGMMPRSGGPAPFTAIRIDDGAPTVAPGQVVSTELVGEGTHRIAYYARDAAGNVNDGARGNGIANRSPRRSRVRIDRTPPRAAFANSQDPRDPDLLRVRIADPLAGPDPARGWIGVRRAGSGTRFERLPPEPPGAGELRARWRSDAHPRGLYEFRAVAYDKAGNTALVDRRRDGSAMTLTNPLKATATLRARFHRGRVERGAPYGRRVRVSGRLTTGRSRAPLAAMPIRVVERFAAGARPRIRVSTVRTNPRGRFSHRLAPGPSRRIEVSFAGTRTLARAAERALALRVRSRASLRTSAQKAKVGGAPLVFSGRLLDTTRAAGGRTVQLQFRVAGLPWAEFRTVKTDRHGRFRYRYRFSDDDSRGARFQFRAFVPSQENWPYEPGGSRPVLVKGL